MKVMQNSFKSTRKEGKFWEIKDEDISKCDLLFFLGIWGKHSNKEHVLHQVGVEGQTITISYSPAIYS